MAAWSQELKGPYMKKFPMEVTIEHEGLRTENGMKLNEYFPEANVEDLKTELVEKRKCTNMKELMEVKRRAVERPRLSRRKPGLFLWNT